MIIEEVPYDKKLHFGAGLGISLVVGIVTFVPLYGLIAGVVAGFAKEVYDWHDYGKFDVKDMIFTWLGTLAGFGIITALHYI